MRRLWFLIAGVAAMLAFAAASTAASPHPWTLDLRLTPTTVVTDGYFDFSGSLIDSAHHGVPQQSISMRWYVGAGCSGTAHEMGLRGPLVTDLHGLYGVKGVHVNLDPGTYSFQASVTGAPWVKSACVTETVTAAGGEPVAPAGEPTVTNVFLCYSTYQVDPGVWPLDVAKTLLTLGYWQPYAVLGNVPGGTNVGAYHLVCNLATGQSVGPKSGYVGDGGTSYGSDLASTAATELGFYPVAG